MTTATLSSLVQSVVPEATVASLIGVSIKTLRNWQSLGKGPVCRRITGRSKIYLADDVYQFLHGTSQPATVAQTATQPGEPSRRGPGRPKGSPTRPKPIRPALLRRP